MKKLILTVKRHALKPIDGKPNGKFKKLMKLRRRYTSAKISDVYSGFDRGIVRSLDPIDWNASGYKPKSFLPQIIEILKHWPEIEELTLGAQHGNSEFTELPVTLMKLKKLVVHGSLSAFHLIEAPALKNLQVRSRWIFGHESKSFERFLRAAPKLECLEVKNLSIFESINSNFPFQLKTLFSDDRIDYLLDDNSKKFFLSHAPTVDKLHAHCDNPEFHEIVLTKFKSLQILETNLQRLTASEEFYANLEPLPLLTEISSDHGFSSEKALRAVLSNCPELVNLRSRNCLFLPKHIDLMAEHNRSLELLEIFTITATNSRFQSLKILILSVVENGDHLASFLKANPTIESLYIRELHEDRFNSESLEVLINETGLKHVEIHGEDSALDEVFQRIKTGYGTWKKLQLCAERLGPYNFHYNFDFPKNPADWKPCEHLMW